MTPAERAVIRAAVALWKAAAAGGVPPLGDLLEATEAMIKEQKGESLTWAEVVESDEVFSPKAGKWYRVRSNNPKGARRIVQAEGVGKPWNVSAAEMVQVRRGATGAAVDTIVEVFRSR